MATVIALEQARGCQVFDEREKNLGYDVTSLDLSTGELRDESQKGRRARRGEATSCRL